MGDTKTTYIMPDQNGFGNNDLATVALLSGGGGFGANNWANNPFMYLVWAYMMRYMNGGDFNNGSNCNTAMEASTQRQIQTLADQMNDNHTSDLIMQAIQGNNNLIQDISTRFGCDINAVSSAIQGVRSDICQVANQLGFSAERVINAVNVGDCNVIQALKDCCCTTQKSILEQGYQNQLANERQTYQITNSINSLGNSVERGFSDSSYATQAQTCALSNTIKDTSSASTASIIAKLDAIQNQNLLDKIDALREKNSQQAVVINNAQQSTLFGQMINQATAPIAGAVSVLQNDINSIKCKLPETVTLPYNCATAIPTSTLYNGWSLNYNGNWGNWSNCGCTNSLWG